MTSPTTFRRRAYNATGAGYESGRYGDVHMEGYRNLRNQTLQNALGTTFPGQSLRILEVGCGTGPTLEFLAQDAVQHRLFGVDASDTMLAQAAEKAANLSNPPRLALGDAAHLPYPDGWFDAVYATRFMHQFQYDTKMALSAEFQRVLRPGGLLILEFYARPYHALRYFLGARKGKSREAYFLHYPTMAEVRAVVGRPFTVHPLRLIGSKLLTSFLSNARLDSMTRRGGRAFGGILVDEYFVVARKS